MPNDLNLTIDSSSIAPLISQNQTQLIFQRHCNYDRMNGGLHEDSIDVQKAVVNAFLANLPLDSLNETYFLFTASNTVSNPNFKRCVETTKIAMDMTKSFLQDKHLPASHIINLNASSNYKQSIHESSKLTEPKMLTDNTGYAEFLQEKHNGMNIDFWIDFEEDLSKEKREELNAEGPDQIVDRSLRYIFALQRYASLFHLQYPHSRLIIWNGTHYDLISPLVKQRILNWPKSSIVNVDYCGGISLILEDYNEIIASVNGHTYPFDSQYKEQLHPHF